MKNMTLKDFIDNYILPNEDDKVALAYYRGEVDYDFEYLMEKAQENGVILDIDSYGTE